MNQLIDSEEQLAAEYHEPLVEELLEWQMQDAVNPMHMPWAVPSLYGFDAPALERWRGRTSRARGQLQKQRFCATYPNVSRCRHGASCAFAHAREEVTAPLLTPEEEAALPESLTVDFFTQRFKTMWCPIGAQHDWQSCMYAHTYQDVRRPPTIGYGHQLCPYWNKKETNLPYAQRCPLGPRCPYAHGAKEQLYHPDYFRSLVCRDLQRRRCPRAHLCAFFHRQSDCRKIKHDSVDYARPLPEKAVPPEWLQHFLNPPKFQEAADGYVEPYLPESLMPAMMSLMGYGKEEWDSGTESTAEELHEDAETTSSQAATLAPPGLGFTEDAWAALLCKNEDMYWREVMPYFNPYSEVGFRDFEEGAYAASVQAAPGSFLRKPLKGSEAPASLLSHLGLGDAAM